MDERQEAAFIKKAARWPLWPFLPMKQLGRSRLNEGLGFLHCTNLDADYPGENEKVVLYELPLHAVALNVDGGRMKVEDLPKKEFDTVEDLVKAGWVVD